MILPTVSASVTLTVMVVLPFLMPITGEPATDEAAELLYAEHPGEM